MEKRMGWGALLARLLLVGLMLFPSLVWADKVFIEPAKITPPADLDPQTLQELVRTAVRGLGHEVVETAAGADFSLNPSLLKLGHAYVLSVDKTVNGKTVNSARLKADSVEELDDVTQRVVRAAITQVVANQDARSSDVTEDEATAGTRRKLNRSGQTFAAGPALLSNLSDAGARLAYYISMGRGWAVGPTLIGFRGDFAIDPDFRAGTALFGDFNINLTYYFIDRDVSPFIDGEFGIGVARHAVTGSVDGGMLLGSTLGVAIFRTYNVHIEIGVRFAALVDISLPTSPLETALRLGVSF